MMPNMPVKYVAYFCLLLGRLKAESDERTDDSEVGSSGGLDFELIREFIKDGYFEENCKETSCTTHNSTEVKCISKVVIPGAKPYEKEFCHCGPNYTGTHCENRATVTNCKPMGFVQKHFGRYGLLSYGLIGVFSLTAGYLKQLY